MGPPFFPRIVLIVELVDSPTMPLAQSLVVRSAGTTSNTRQAGVLHVQHMLHHVGDLLLRCLLLLELIVLRRLLLLHLQM